MDNIHGVEVASADVVIACAMEEELAPFLEGSDDVVELPWQRSKNDHQHFYAATLEGTRVLLVRSGIGLANAAAAATRALSGTSPTAYIIAGTAGGLATKVSVRDVVAAVNATYFGADATAFGYAPGQVPQMPERYSTELQLPSNCANWVGQAVSGDSFITAANVSEIRERFPLALAVDMETTAAAQVCHLFGVPWLSLRAISDLCGPLAGQEFHVEVDEAAHRSYVAVRRLLTSKEWGKSPDSASPTG